MKRVLVFTAFALLQLTGCVISETDRVSLTEVLEIYGGTATLAKGTGTSGKYYEVTLTGTEAPFQHDQSLAFPAHNIARILYAGMDSAAKESYDEIRLVVKSGNVELNRTVDVAFAKMLVAHAERTDVHKEALKLGQFNAFYLNFDTTVRNVYSLDSFNVDIGKTFAKAGDIEIVYPLGADTAVFEGVKYLRYMDFYKGADSLPNVLTSRSYRLDGNDSIYGFTFELRNPN